jgi:cytoskeletal protein RodZ
MWVVLALVVLVLVVLLWRAFVFDRKHRGRLRSAADISADAKRNRDEQRKGSDF